MNYSNLTQWCMKTESQERDAVSTAGETPPCRRLNLQSNQLPSVPLQLWSSMWGGEEIEATAYIIPELLQSKVLRRRDAGGGIHQFIAQRKVISSCSSRSSVAICSADRNSDSDVMFFSEQIIQIAIYLFFLFKENSVCVFHFLSVSVQWYYLPVGCSVYQLKPLKSHWD